MATQSNSTASPPGMFGPERDHLIDSVVRAIAEHFAPDPRQWSSKYGTAVKTEIFEMHPFCWCENDDCPWCGEQNLPNFHYKPLDFKLWWYKYIGRGMEMNREISALECASMLERCLNASPRQPTPHT